MSLHSKLESLSGTLASLLGDALLGQHIDRDELTIDVDPARIDQVCRLLKNSAELAFTQLSDLSGVDYLTYGQADWQTQATSSGFSRGVSPNSIKAGDADSKRFAVVYQLLSVTNNLRLRVKARTRKKIAIMSADAVCAVVLHCHSSSSMRVSRGL